jgi:D-glycero-D-manno-heptose 1,7-bisphosphate phosphatase
MRIVFSELKSPIPVPAIFIDRDGVVNVRRANGYVLEWSQFVFTPGIRAALKDLYTLRLPLILVSNQAAVGKGLLTVQTLREITERMQGDLISDGARFTACYYCTHKPAEGCACRKPRPGLIYKAAVDFNIDLSQSVFIGDSETDVQAARNAGCRPVLFNSGLSTGLESTPWIERALVARTAEELATISIRQLAQFPERR